ncbi:MAG: hypothetical protein SYC29_06635 [Planctomycetota bacterium]|nr:hypothetical protein [Planctomycetota bacterium]
MDRPLTAVLLAGTLRPSPLREALDVPALCLPMGSEGTVLDAWLRALAGIDGLHDVRIVVNTEHDVQAIESCHQRGGRSRAADDARGAVRGIAEPASWRGAGGILRDVTGDLEEEAIVIVIEANALPPASLAPLRDAWRDDRSGVVGVCGADEPAGVYAFARRTFGMVPPVGYFDLKEQFLPALAGDGVAVGAARVGARLLRLFDRGEYLAALRESLSSVEDGVRSIRLSPQASVSSSAVLDGRCIIEDGVLIEDGAVVHDSVLLSGATIGGGAIISQSIVGPLAAITARREVIRSIVPGAPARVAPPAAIPAADRTGVAGS